MKIIYTALFIIYALISVNAQTPLTEAIDFTAKSVDGETVHLFEYLDQDKLVVIDFFSTSCGPCAEYAPQIQASHENFGSNEGNVIFIGVCWGDNDEGVIYFDSVHGITYPSISGFDGGGNQIMSNYQIQSYPTLILIMPDGTIENQYIWEPTTEYINEVVVAAGGILTSIREDNYTAIFEATQLYPVPAQSEAYLNFTLKSDARLEFKIFDLLGKEVLKLKEQRYFEGSNNINFNVDGLDNGTYIMGIIRDSRLIASKRLIIAN